MELRPRGVAEIEVLIVTGLTSARAEAARTSIKQVKRGGRGFCSEPRYRDRILVAGAARRAALPPISMHRIARTYEAWHSCYRPHDRLQVASFWRFAVPDTTCHMSISLDGFVAGPDQSREDPLGKRGLELHGWHIGDPRATDADKIASEWLMRSRGAYVMGRNMFGPIRGDWDEDWSGWWGTEPPYHAPVFVLTHHPRDPIQMDGGTTFHFITEGFDAAYSAACEAAGDDGVDIAGGASTVRQALIAGVIDELTLDIAPVLLGSGERIFDEVESFDFQPAEVLHSPLATHIRYRRVS